MAGCGSSSDDGTPLDDSGSIINPPSMPTDLQGVVYSSTAIELEWNAATDDGMVVEYQVFRDGSLIATQSTLHFFEDNLTAATTHSYSVLAVDDEGNVSDAAIIDVTTLDDGPAISEANYSVILPFVIDIANGTLFNELRVIVDATDGLWLTAFNVDELAGLELIDQGVDPTNDRWDKYTYDCEFGGSYVLYQDNWRQFSAELKGFYDSCEIGNNNLSGNFTRYMKLDREPPNNEVQTTVYDLTVHNDSLGSQRSLTGNITVNNSEIENRYSFSEASYSQHNLMWSTTISDIVIDVYATDEEPLMYYAVPFSRTFDANFRVQGPQTGDEWLTVAIQFATNDDTELNYQSGSLTVTAEDGSSMRMAADNSDPDTIQLSFSHADSSTALTIPWSDVYRLACFHVPTLEAQLADCE